ncbi:MAG: FtsW/RodA/SpoVE family cell cycle protein, partial [Erysipelotrichaceae bacterium]|nr:FtsW/RodA/SpoVE family cell cycle protein [Erysipelotrichaceae bacterium]
ILGAVVSQYQLNRIEAWLNPDDYILGSSNQLYTALLSLGSAGLTGHGMQANIISIPEAHTDFIFAAFGQCFGFLGCIFIVLLCLVLDLYLLKMAFNAQSRSDRLMIIGAAAMLFYQQFQNLGMIVGLVPITGITLPLISYGGSSMLSYFILFGFILNVSPSSRKSFRIKKPNVKKLTVHMKLKNFIPSSKKTQES